MGEVGHGGKVGNLGDVETVDKVVVVGELVVGELDVAIIFYKLILLMIPFNYVRI